MQHISSTPFGRRPVTAGLLAARALARGPAGADAPCPAVGKWQILRELTAARAAFGLSDRDLTVLAALLSFHPEEAIGGQAAGRAVVFPSNASLSQRAHGMAESTLRRHLAALVSAGMILRQDSPNGKRYAIRRQGATPERAFGFDLSPLGRRADEIAKAAESARHQAEALRDLREDCVLLLRDCEKLLAYLAEARPGGWDGFADAITLARRALRRKPDPLALAALRARLGDVLAGITAACPPDPAEEMGGKDRENERHIQDSPKDMKETEAAQPAPPAPKDTPAKERDEMPALPVVLQACPEILAYAPDGVRNWRDLLAAAGFVSGMIGIRPETWADAQRRMSPPVAAVALACILQSFDRIASPGAYLRKLSRQAEAGTFSPRRMVAALLRPAALSPETGAAC